MFSPQTALDNSLDFWDIYKNPNYFKTTKIIQSRPVKTAANIVRQQWSTTVESSFGTIKRNSPLFKSNVMKHLTKEQLLNTLNESKMSVGKATEAYREAGLTLQHFKKEHQDIIEKFNLILYV